MSQKSFSLKNIKTLIISEQGRIADSQIYPFYFYRKQLNDRYGFTFKEVKMREFLDDPDKAAGRESYDLIFFQTWFENQNIDEILQKIQQIKRNAKLIYLDWFAPLFLPYPEVLPHVDLYIKKQVCKFLSNCGSGRKECETVTIFYYTKLFGLKCDKYAKPIPKEHLNKIVLGWNFITAKLLFRPWRFFWFLHSKRNIDIHCRIATEGSSWYQMSRQLALNELLKLNNKYKVIACNQRVRLIFYMRELYKSKICVSPFGYGEICLRDIEAIESGAMLIKPSVEHLVTEPNLFIPYVTYVPVKWDFSDLVEKCEYYLTHEAERLEIAKNVRKAMMDYFERKEFLKKIEEILIKIDLFKNV